MKQGEGKLRRTEFKRKAPITASKPSGVVPAVPRARKPPRAARARSSPASVAALRLVREDLGPAWPPPPKRRGEVHHHVVKESVQERAGGDKRDGRNLLSINWKRHLGHHWEPGSKLPLSVLRDHHFEYARVLLGAGRAYEHLRRYYTGEDPRLDALLAEYEAAG